MRQLVSSTGAGLLAVLSSVWGASSIASGMRSRSEFSSAQASPVDAHTIHAIAPAAHAAFQQALEFLRPALVQRDILRPIPERGAAGLRAGTSFPESPAPAG